MAPVYSYKATYFTKYLYLHFLWNFVALRGGSEYHALCSDETPDAIKRESDVAPRPWECKLPLAHYYNKAHREKSFA